MTTTSGSETIGCKIPAIKAIFGASNMDTFGGLLNGATVCAYDMRRDGIPQLAGWLDRERITVLHAVPTVFRELCNSLPPARMLPHLRAIDLPSGIAHGDPARRRQRGRYQ